MSKFRIPFTLGHLVLSSRLFQVPEVSSIKQASSSSSGTISEQNLEQHVPGCILLVAFKPSSHLAHAELLTSFVEAWPTTKRPPGPDRMNRGRARDYYYLHKRKRGWRSLSRSSLCILAGLSFSIGNLFNGTSIRILVAGASLSQDCGS